MAFTFGLRKEKDRASVIKYPERKFIVLFLYLNLQSSVEKYFEHEVYLQL